MPQIVMVVTASEGSKAAKPLAKRTSILSWKPEAETLARADS